VAESGDVQLTPGNQPTAILNTSKLKANHSATIYYVNCADYYSKCPEAAGFDGRISSIEYFKDEDVANTPP
jgi:hypothetical protein